MQHLNEKDGKPKSIREASTETATLNATDLERPARGGDVREDEVPKESLHFIQTEEGLRKVQFVEGDPENPRNWSRGKKWYLTILCSYLNILVSSQASAYSTGQTQIVEEFGISDELAIGGLSLYILGFAIGPMLMAPLSETFGRRRVYVWCWTLFVLLQFGVAFAPNIPVLFVFRFLTGFFSSPPLANTGGVISDLWARDESGPAMAFYTFGSCMAPQLGNVYAGFIAQQLGWRWIFYLTSLLILGLHWFLIFFTLKETRHNILLEKKAARLRTETGDETYVSFDSNETKTMWQLLQHSLSRPFVFLATEPITMFASLWNGLLFGLIFLFNEAFVAVFGPGEGYNWQHPGVVQLTFLALVVGEVIGYLLYPFTQERYYQKAIKKAGQSVPEARMASGVVGCCLLPVGLFIFAWTCDRSISFIVPLIGAAIFGLGFFQVLYGILSWTIDSYQEYAASALGATILVRNLLGAAFPLIGRPMYQNLGRHWASSLIAFLGVPLIPISWMFFFKGHLIRAKSPYAATHFQDGKDEAH
ncbi:hypothetical protein CBS101457_005048 [Exobasidium rhododendri]|nr:hypothetical protein CBS101457_005048 [Exobasidium rhododendri]